MAEEENEHIAKVIDQARKVLSLRYEDGVYPSSREAIRAMRVLDIRLSYLDEYHSRRANRGKL